VKTGVAVLLVLLAAGCTRMEYALGRIPWLAYMRDAPFFDPYEAPRPAPIGSVPFSSPAGEVLVPIQPAEVELQAFAAGPDGTNPFPIDSAFRATGRDMFDRYCMVCHGTNGLGDGPIRQTSPEQDKYPLPVPNLTLPLTAGRADGYIYGVVWVGRGLMPAYGPRTTHRERWAIVEYVRELQRAAGTLPPRTGGGN
jgi:mono/diheme cytochrome c family protein